MGKTPKPRVLCVTDAGLRASKEIKALEAKGHRILSWEETGNLVQPDLILGPNCRMVVLETVKYVALALKELGKPVKEVLAGQSIEAAAETAAKEEDDDELST